MKKEQNRYYLVEYARSETKHYNTREELDKALDDIRKYNNRQKESYLIGNMSVVENNGFELTTNLYHKLSKRLSISAIDSVTSKYTENELVIALSKRLRSIYPEYTDNKPFYPDINIAYFEDRDEKDRDDNLIRRIKYIPVLYKNDLDYVNVKKVRNMLEDHANNVDIDFFEALVEEYKQNRSVDKELDDLLIAIDRVKNLRYATDNLFYASVNLYNALILEVDKYGNYELDDKGYVQKSRRRLRDFGFFIKNYNSKNYKSTKEYNYKNNKEKIEYFKRIREELIKRNAKNMEAELKLTKKKK